jgi:DNA-binding CsgD family transcriptional regulator
MSAAETLDVARSRLNRLAHGGWDSFAYRRRAIRELRAVVAFDAVWWWTIDPASTFFTSGVFEPSPDNHDICGGLHGNEISEQDFNKFRALAYGADRVGVLSAATRGYLERSNRYRHMLAPLGYEHELRLALSDGAALWGGIALLRMPSGLDFSPAEARRAGALGPILTHGLRIGIALGPASVDCPPGGPGMLIVDDELNILTMTSNADGWLGELADGSLGLPDAVRSAVEHVKALGAGDPGKGRVPRARVRGRSGKWLAIYASRTRDGNGPSSNLAVIIEEATPSEIAPLIVSAYGLSGREARVTRLVLQGRTSREIAAELYLSVHTVNDHLKTIYGKVGVHSRQELTATIFEQHHWPRFGFGEHPPEPDGAISGIHQAGTPGT